MFTAYIVVTVLAAAANVFSAGCDFVRYKQVSIAMAKAGVPDSWMTTLGILKAAGALGLLAGLGVPRLGTAAATGLVLFFCRCDHHPPARTRLLIRSGSRISSAGRCRTAAGTE